MEAQIGGWAEKDEPGRGAPWCSRLRSWLGMAQPPPAALEQAHPSCLAVVCLLCPSLPAAGSAVILASATLRMPSCSWPGNWLLPSPQGLRQRGPGGRWLGSAGQNARLLSLCCQQPWDTLWPGAMGPECQPQEQWTMEVVHGGPAASPRQCLHPLMMDRESGGSLSGWVLVVSQAPCPLIPP